MQRESTAINALQVYVPSLYVPHCVSVPPTIPHSLCLCSPHYPSLIVSLFPSLPPTHCVSVPLTTPHSLCLCSPHYPSLTVSLFPSLPLTHCVSVPLTIPHSSGESSVSQRQSIRKLRQNIANMRTPPVECVLDSGLGETGCSLEGGGTGFGSHGPQAWLTHSTLFLTIFLWG